MTTEEDLAIMRQALDIARVLHPEMGPREFSYHNFIELIVRVVHEMEKVKDAP